MPNVYLIDNIAKDKILFKKSMLYRCKGLLFNSYSSPRVIGAPG